MPIAPTDDIVSVAEAADELCVDRRTVLHWIKAGKAQAEKLGTGRTSAYYLTRAELERLKQAS